MQYRENKQEMSLKLRCDDVNLHQIRISMSWLRIKKKMLTPDECAGELYYIVFWVLSYFKATFIEENEEMDEGQLVQILNDRNYEMLLLTLWIMHTYLPSEKLRDKVYERFFKAVKAGSRDIGRSKPLDVFQDDLRDRLKAYTHTYNKLRFSPSVGVDEFGGMIAQVIQHGNHPLEPPSNLTPYEARKWHFRARVAMNKWQNEIKRRHLIHTIEKYADPDLSHLQH